MICTDQATRNGSCLTKASVVKLKKDNSWSIPLINPRSTLHWHLDWHLIDNLIDSQATLDRHLDRHSSNGCLLLAECHSSHMYQSPLNGTGVSAQISWLPTDCRLTHDHGCLLLVHMIWKNYNNDDQFGNWRNKGLTYHCLANTWWLSS